MDQLKATKVEFNESKESKLKKSDADPNNDDIMNRFLIDKKKPKSREL